MRATHARVTRSADRFRAAAKGCREYPTTSTCRRTESLSYAQELLGRGLAFNAHEVLEAAWKNGPADERALWQGLAQLAVGFTHVQRGNVAGADALNRPRRGPAEVLPRRPAPHRVDVDGLVSARRAARRGPARRRDDRTAAAGAAAWWSAGRDRRAT